MDEHRQSELESKLRATLREHQQEGLNMIGNSEELVHRLVRAVSEWIEDRPVYQQRSA